MAAPATTLYSLEEISRHSTRGDSWLVIDDGVYDVSKFAAKHPGGSIIFQHAGGDATDAFHAFHLENTAARMLPSFKIGEVKDSRPVPPHVRDFRLFRQEVEANGYMKADLGWFLKYFILVCCIYAAGVMVPLFLGRSWLATMLSAVIVGFSYGQSGFIFHDLGHNSVFKSHRANLLAHMVVFNTMLGGSASWWRGRHNRHHVSPNNVDVDLDIRTLPLIGWDEAQVREASKGGKINKHLRYQHLYFPFIGPPLLFVLYRVINAQWIITKRLGQEAIFTSIHFLFKFTVVFSMVGFSITQLLAWELITLVVGGAYLGWVFSLNHYMFPLLHDGANDDWVLSTTTTTQNVSGGKLLDFLTGHLDYQVEHHLFPRMPRHSYPAVHKSLKKLLASHGIELHVKSPITAVADVFKTLKDATRGLEPAKPAAPSASARMMLNMEEEERTLRRSTTISKSSDSVYSR